MRSGHEAACIECDGLAYDAGPGSGLEPCIPMQDVGSPGGILAAKPNTQRRVLRLNLVKSDFLWYWEFTVKKIGRADQGGLCRGKSIFVARKTQARTDIGEAS